MFIIKIFENIKSPKKKATITHNPNTQRYGVLTFYNSQGETHFCLETYPNRRI